VENPDENVEITVELNFDFISSKDEYNFEGAQKRIDYILHILGDFLKLNKFKKPRND